MVPLAARLSEEFRPYLEGIDVEALETEAATVCGVTPELTLGYVNPAWVRFAEQNGGSSRPDRWGLGVSIETAITGPLRALYVHHYRSAALAGVAWEHTYECPSPVLDRVYRLRLVPLERGGAVALHDLVHQAPRNPASEEPAEGGRYVDGDDIVTQCGHCRRVLRVDRWRWDFVPRYLSKPWPRTSHGLCDSCAALYFPVATSDARV